MEKLFLVKLKKDIRQFEVKARNHDNARILIRDKYYPTIKTLSQFESKLINIYSINYKSDLGYTITELESNVIIASGLSKKRAYNLFKQKTKEQLNIKPKIKQLY